MNHIDNHKELDICSKYLSDREYLEHMIPHHQVAIDMSKVFIDSVSDSNNHIHPNPNLALIVRRIIFGQQDQILEMIQMLNSFIPNISSNDKSLRKLIKGRIELDYPNESELKKAKCKSHFFKLGLNELKNMSSERKYLEHMIPHHQVAVNMSEILLKHSNNTMIISLAYSIITNQKYEIWRMKDMYKNKYKVCFD